MMQDIANKTALITGGTKGIGYGIAAALMEQGMKVAITSRSQEAAEKAAAQLNQAGNGEAFGVQADVRDFDSQQKAIDKVVEKWGQLDLLVANAGIGHFANIADLTVDQWHETIETNLTGVFYSIKAGLEALKASKGFFITISSLAGTNFFANGSAYNASKFGVTGFTQAVMLDVRQHGIRCTTIMPGSVATHFNDHVPSEKDSWKIQIEDIGKLVVDLMQMHPRSLPSKIEIRPSMPG
jgi:3-oxoacyl-[acyl-carrier protein] reductase